MELKLTEGIICERLHQRYADAKYKVSNAFIFKYDWESDFFLQNRNNYCYEFEVKISRADFFNDKKKVNKHLILETGMFQYREGKSVWNPETKRSDWEYTDTDREWNRRPNKFYYVVPEGLITADEVPKYAGLIYCPIEEWKGVTTIKEAPFIHKEKLEVEKILCPKFYHYWMNERNENYRLKQKIKELEFKNNQLKPA